MTNRLFLIFFYCHKNTTVPPRWILEPTDKAFAQGSNAKVECKSDGFPKPQIVWKKAVGECFNSLTDFITEIDCHMLKITLFICDCRRHTRRIQGYEAK